MQPDPTPPRTAAGDDFWNGAPRPPKGPSRECDDGSREDGTIPWMPGGPLIPPPPASPQEVAVERSRLREIRDGLPEAAEPLDSVIKKIVALSVAESTFTSFTYSLALAYNEAEAYTLRELKGKAEDIVVIRDEVGLAAATWANAESAATLREI
ncbi:hypothetical protein IMZ11_08625 [Microtetraspora sp. AC03309]|uniref:hypothetical protein n=1 Tax=Microtetraspora sp. AC03309 TaxID=2779376 RepID=UPI001E293D86|nr:hypothetical protein [Microtetraspora sp. AC03309]MCC5575705.1 hypothetical protein [Microtetraspora sp. AC03309]